MRYLITVLFLLFLFSPLAKAQETSLHLENVMNKDELISTGLSKLSPEEKAAFNKWLDKYVERIAIFVGQHRLDDDSVIKLQPENVFYQVKNFRVRVLCSDIALTELNEIGITNQQLQIAVEVLLRKAGIEVVDQFIKGESNILIVGVEMIPIKDIGAVSYFITFRTSEILFAQRQNIIYSFGNLNSVATTQLGVTSKAYLGQKIKNGIDAGLDEIINNYLRANPKK